MTAPVPALQFEKLTKRFDFDIFKKPHVALQDLSLSVPEGSVYGFVGHNGAGKTTAIKLAMGLIHATSGGVRIFGEPHTDVASRRHVGFLPERPYFYEYLTAREALDFYGSLASIPAATLKTRIDELLDRVGLASRADERLRNFSKGMLQRLGIAQAILANPRLLILDEPMSGLDPLGRKEIREIIVELHRAGTTIFFSSHVLSDVEALCDRVALIARGRLYEEGLLTDILRAGQLGVDIVFIADAERARVAFGDRFEEKRIPATPGRVAFRVAEAEVAELLQHALGHGLIPEVVQPAQRRLEDVFAQHYQAAGLAGVTTE